MSNKFENEMLVDSLSMAIKKICGGNEAETAPNSDAPPMEPDNKKKEEFNEEVNSIELVVASVENEVISENNKQRDNDPPEKQIFFHKLNLLRLFKKKTVSDC